VPPQKISPLILAAKSVLFDDQTGVPTVGKEALAGLKTWGRFQIVADKSQADLIFVLSASPPKGDHILYSGGQTGTIDNSGIHEDPVPQYLVSGPARNAYLTVFDAKTGTSLWTDSHQWGGLLTGHNCPPSHQTKKRNEKIVRSPIRSQRMKGVGSTAIGMGLKRRSIA
jgi:hypothetical protein